jgi:hypothetical protein
VTKAGPRRTVLPPSVLEPRKTAAYRIRAPLRVPSPDVLIGAKRLLELRQSKNLSQGDIEKKTGLIRCYTSRVECGHTVSPVETLEN